MASFFLPIRDITTSYNEKTLSLKEKIMKKDIKRRTTKAVVATTGIATGVVSVYSNLIVADALIMGICKDTSISPLKKVRPLKVITVATACVSIITSVAIAQFTSDVMTMVDDKYEEL